MPPDLRPSAFICVHLLSAKHCAGVLLKGVTFKHARLTRQIIGAFYDVYNELGYGFLERVYGSALAIELRKMGIELVENAPLRVSYRNTCIGEYVADLLVDGLIIVELKAAKTLAAEHSAQLLNYLKATRCEVGLLLNFGPRPEIRRLAFDNDRKGSLSWVD